MPSILGLAATISFITVSDMTQKSVLTIAATKYLTGTTVEQLLEDKWSKAPSKESHRFNNVGFDVDPDHVSETMNKLREELKDNDWDGVILGWCIRGHVEFTIPFEKIMNLVAEKLRSKQNTKMIFVTGPDDLVEATQRTFALHSSEDVMYEAFIE